MPSVGKLILEDGRFFDLKLTNEIRVLGGGRFVTVITAKPIAFLGADRPDAKPVEDYAVGVVDLNLKADGGGTGTAAPAAKVKIGTRAAFRSRIMGPKRYGSRRSRKSSAARTRAFNHEIHEISRKEGFENFVFLREFRGFPKFLDSFSAYSS